MTSQPTTNSLVPQELADQFPADRPVTGYGVHRVVGLETEFGIHAPQQPGASHTVMSLELVNAYGQKLHEAGISVGATEWDYGEESPLTDARGWRMPRSIAHPTQLTDEPLLDDDGRPVEMLVNLILPNGARFYVDHAHPEYSSPETTNPMDAVIWDQAGDRIAQAAADFIGAQPGNPQVVLYKNNTDSKSVSYGAHENYLTARELEFAELAAHILPFFTARQVITGAGRVGVGSLNQHAGFQISQRADFFEAEVGLETTINRPIVNTRDEPHARADMYRRLHVIIGDANLSEYSTWLRVGMTSIMLWLIELGRAPMLELAEPVQALQTISHDPGLKATVVVNGQGRMTGLDVLETYLQAAEEAAQEFQLTDAQTAEILQAWREVLDQLRVDPMKLADRLDWLAKYQLLEGMRARHGLDWSHPKLAMLDLQWADLRRDKGLYYALAARGSIRRLTTDDQIERAIGLPPQDTRAWTRGRTIAQFGNHLEGVSWDSLVVRPYHQGRMHRFGLRDPLQATATDAVGVLGAEMPPVPATQSPDADARIEELLDYLSPYTVDTNSPQRRL